ncbi:hypothetical protein T190611E02C_30099 [Tenacibaculum sp. 190524A05c]
MAILFLLNSYICIYVKTKFTSKITSKTFASTNSVDEANSIANAGL